VIFTNPAGEVFKQATAQEFSNASHIVFACGRYEGIDQRVIDYAKTKAKVRLVSIGDYILNGGEVAAIAMIESIARLIPGVIGNAESLAEESHNDSGLLEYPSYTKPASWRGFDVPEVLTSGNHAAIAAWRHQKQIERTREVRPDLLND
jgi:tRNA (guanine37-N1)-methyltransferase